MIVGGYTLDLYCRNDSECSFIGKEYEDFPGGNKFVSYEASKASIHGRSEGACLKDAKVRGWVLAGGDVVCKWCAAMKGKKI